MRNYAPAISATTTPVIEPGLSSILVGAVTGNPAVLVALGAGAGAALPGLVIFRLARLYVALRAKLLPGEHAAAQCERPPGGSLEACNALLQGRFYYFRETEADYRKAIQSYTQAIGLDPRYALAWSRLSGAWTDLSGYFLGDAAAQEANQKRVRQQTVRLPFAGVRRRARCQESFASECRLRLAGCGSGVSSCDRAGAQ